MKQIGSAEKKSENLMQNLTFLLFDKLQKYWLCRHTSMPNSPLVAIGDGCPPWAYIMRAMKSHIGTLECT
jgi:hypothetical protein